MRNNMDRDEMDAQTGGLHPAEICGEDCSGCCGGDEEPAWPASEYFQPDPSPYTLASLRSYRDHRGETHYY